MSITIHTAASQLGVKEISGAQSNSKILQYAKDIGINNYTNDDAAWCSLFVNWVAHKSGLETTGKLTARSWLNVGFPTDRPEPGDVVVFWRESRNSWKGHVGFFTGFSHNLSRIYCLGGNQGNQVSITAYGKDRLLGFRRLRKVGVNEIKDEHLKRGSHGIAVAELQDILKQLGYDCGTTDGKFGPKTEQSLKDFQASSGFLELSGKLDKATREFLDKVMENHLLEF